MILNEYILVTGGLGYIGSHTVIKLLNNKYKVIIVDNLSNSNIESLDKIELITNNKPLFFNCDIRDKYKFNNLIKDFNITSVIHFAAFKSVSESITKSNEYYDNNVNGTIQLLNVMKENNIKNIIFSSSCTVYGEPEKFPVSEETPIKIPKTPYGISKFFCEKILKDNKEINTLILRYFNPIGNHESGLIYEKPKGIPENLLPYIISVIKGNNPYLKIFGNDYNTKDGTAIRDYIDVNDLAQAHINGLKYVNKHKYDIINIGNGIGYTVLEIINEFENQGIKIPYKIYPRRNGDIEKIYTTNNKARDIINWNPDKKLSDSIRTIIKTINNQ